MMTFSCVLCVCKRNISPHTHLCNSDLVSTTSLSSYQCVHSKRKPHSRSHHMRSQWWCWTKVHEWCHFRLNIVLFTSKHFTFLFFLLKIDFNFMTILENYNTLLNQWFKPFFFKNQCLVCPSNVSDVSELLLVPPKSFPSIFLTWALFLFSFFFYTEVAQYRQKSEIK